MADTATLISGATTTGTAAGVIEHPLYVYFAPTWRKLAHAVEGIEGFADGTYLIGHPREYLDHVSDAPVKPTAKLKERRRLARYENWPRTLLALITGALFRQAAFRRAGDDRAAQAHPLAAWWANVDGLGTDIDHYLQRQWAAAAVYGHTFVVMDRPLVASPTNADAPGLYLRGYSPLDVPDWLCDDMGALSAVALTEAAPRTNIGQRAADLAYTRILTRDGYELRGANVERLGLPALGLSAVQGAVPVVPVYARRRPLLPVIGQSILGDPQLYVDDYNLTSEIRELLRKQTFSVINIPLGTGDAAQSLTDAQAMLGATIGTTNVLFSAQQAGILSPSTDNVDVYQAERQELRRSMFRAAGVPWESDSKEAEAEGSLKLKREGLNQTLAQFAAELESADLAIARLWMQAEYGDRWQDEWDRANVTIAYPRSFDADDLDTLIARAQIAVGMGLGQTATTRLKAQVVAQLLPNQTPQDEQTIAAELEAEAAADVAQRDAMRAVRATMAAGPRGIAPADEDEDDDENLPPDEEPPA